MDKYDFRNRRIRETCAENATSKGAVAQSARQWQTRTTSDPGSVGLHTLELADVSSGYAGKPVLHDIAFKAQESSIYVVLGLNGAGKTTLFRTIAGILEPY